MIGTKAGKERNKIETTRFKQVEVHFKKLKIINRLMGDRT
jgi:hypothetical protein